MNRLDSAGSSRLTVQRNVPVVTVSLSAQEKPHSGSVVIGFNTKFPYTQHQL